MITHATERAELEHLRLATRLSGLYTWSFELGPGALGSAPASFTGLTEALGHEPATSSSTLDGFVELVIVDEDRPRFVAELQAHLDGATDRYESEHRVRHADGSVRWMLARGAAVRDAAGQPLRIAGSSLDVTRLTLVAAHEATARANDAEEETRAVKERLDEAIRLSGIAVFEMDLRGLADPAPPSSSAPARTSTCHPRWACSST